jgi:hypothetical protein
MAQYGCFNLRIESEAGDTNAVWGTPQDATPGTMNKTPPIANSTSPSSSNFTALFDIVSLALAV